MVDSLSIKMALYQRFFRAAQIDLDSAKILTGQNKIPPALYHLQQAYEKCIKSHFIFKETTINKTPEAEAYNKIKSFKHEVERSTIELTHGIVDLQRRQCNIELCNSSNSEDRQALRNTITAINGVKLSLS